MLRDGSLAVMGVETSGLTVRSLPSVVQISLVVALAAPPTEAGQEFELRASILDAALDEVGSPLSAMMQLNPSPVTPEGWELRGLVPVRARFEVRSAGPHSAELRCGEGRSYSVPFFITEVPTPAT